MSIILKPHNVVTYEKVNENLKKDNKTAVIQPTGTGKMYIGLKYVEDNKEKKAIYIAPSNSILHDVKKNIFAAGMTMQDFSNLKRITYQKLANLSDEEIEKLEADIIIVDEFHHCGAPIWGNGVSRLMERNPNAKILGFSATPLRYNDGLRDMADEMFENNVALEMNLEEAIEKGILPEATYVSTLYGYEQALGKMQTDIDRMKSNIENRKQAQDLLNELRKKLDENTKNLPELLSEHMKNKNGKYIVFCKNIDDMNEKIKQAQKMFGGVNSNIKIRAVSSKVKESDRILTEFEQDIEEGTLKLLYAVDMISEGYHVKGLDGVIMMRPTYSPTVFTQQMGRGLTVGNDKKTVILDLVNNFDSCKIIEDLTEKMKQYKDRKGTDEKEKRKISRLSILDKTKDFREIAEKIAELSKRRTISLEEKIEIFKRFAETEEELVGKTIFEGYPIGQWAIQLRSQINNQKLELSEEPREELENLGILNRQIDSTIEEKIDALIEWNKEYPNVRLYKKDWVNEMERIIEKNKKYPHMLNEDDKYWLDMIDNGILERYKKLQRYYESVKDRKYRGKLTEDQIRRCKEGNVRGVFGYPESTEKITREYAWGCIEHIDDILSYHGSMNEYFLKFGLCFRRRFEVNLKNDEGIEKLLSEMIGGIPIIYNRDVILEQLDKIELPENQRKALMEYCGINKAEIKEVKDIAKEMGVSRTTVHNYINKAVKTLWKHKKDLDITFIPDFDKIGQEDKKIIIESLGNYISDSTITYNRDNLNELVEICKNIEKNGTAIISDEEKEKIEKEKIEKERIEKEKIFIKEQIKDMQEQQIGLRSIPMGELLLPVRIDHALRREGIKTVQDIIDRDDELDKIRGISKQRADKIRKHIAVYRQIIEDDSIEIKGSQGQRLLSLEEEYQKLIEEQEQKDRDGIIDSSTPEEEAKRIEEENEKTELEMLREKRDQLLKQQREMQEKIKQAKELVSSYDRLKGNLQETDFHDLDDE